MAESETAFAQARLNFGASGARLEGCELRERIEMEETIQARER